MTGYSGDGVVECVDIDECVINTHSCITNSHCENTYGSFNCPCDVGYSGDGRVECKNIDECDLDLDNCDIDKRAICIDTDGSFKCACQPGYTGSGVKCSDINECALDRDDCHKIATCVRMAVFNVPVNLGTLEMEDWFVMTLMSVLFI